MPIQHSVWKIGNKPVPLTVGQLATEQKLEELILQDSTILSNEWMLIGRQENTGFGGRIDLLAIEPDGSLILIELKRNKTPRDIIAQALDYASWVGGLTAEEITNIYQRFSNGGNLSEAFKKRFDTDLYEDSLNQSHKIIIVAAELDAATERIINYLDERGLAINAIFFRVFQDGDQQLLSRAWLIDPAETQTNVMSTTQNKGNKEPWNGEYYVSFGDMNSRNWEDARRYGFISAGGGTFYSQTLKLLSPGDRVWVNIPKTGYVGVGEVIEPVQSGKDFKVQTEKGEQPVLDVLQHAALYKVNANDPEKAEYFVRIKWIDTVPMTNAFKEIGLFGNQNTVCQPTAPKWPHTIEQLKKHFLKWNKD